MSMLYGALVLCCLCWPAVSAEDGLSSAAIQTRFESLEKQGHDQRTLLDAQRSELNSLRSVVDAQNRKIETQERLIADLLAREQEREARDNYVVQTDARDPVIKAHDAGNDVRKLKDNHTGLNRAARQLLNSGDDPVAFHTVLGKNAAVEHLGINQHIVYDVVHVNLGGAYHNLQGTFIAPRSGLYMFSLSALSHSTSILSNSVSSIDAYIVKNGNRLAGAYGHGDSKLPWDQGSVTIVTQLAVGDEVWSQTGINNQAIFGNYFSSFMGCLLFPME